MIYGHGFCRVMVCGWFCVFPVGFSWSGLVEVVLGWVLASCVVLWFVLVWVWFGLVGGFGSGR